MWAEGDWIKSKNQVTVAHAWTTRNSRRSRSKFSCSFFKVVLKYLKFYCQYSSLAGIKYLANSRTWTESFHANVTDLSVGEILGLLVQLGSQYASEFEMDKNRNKQVHQLLTTYYEGDYDMIDIMKTLSPPCSTMLLKCKLHGKIQNCSRLFTFRKTQDGFCCAFNYAREDDDIPVMPDVLKSIPVYPVYDLGIDRGLTVLLDPFLDDYFYQILPIMGWKVILFDPHDYPDVTSGGVIEILAMPSSETYVDVTATSFISTKAIEGYSIAKRKCIFSKEIQTLYGGTRYTYSDCIVDCKIHDIQNLCGCRPFFYPRRGKYEYAIRICNNMDLDCLAKYKSKWWTVFPHDDSNNDEHILHQPDGLHCRSCYPVCEDTTYDVLSSKSYMTPGTYMTEFLRNATINDQAILHVFFSKYGSIRLKQDVAYYWYELMSDIGGICGVFIGFSLISVVEILYFVMLVFREMLCKRWVIEDESREKEIPNQPIRTIYWSELLPRTWQAAPYYGHLPKNRTKY
ncbi:PREDICTED: sodium channel protein Nach-like [Dinoponera quadriceps]|uniref:Sodium channel protein Nach-like n=1 Tax=Dinoponera quadriceps TaxID=609295 RepID=A0A6P3YAJ0_DINQU|nr:PREDICTED: sodium channel protein Nach-like [Dinoponera quadriceps]